MSKEERRRRRKVQKAWDYFDHLAKSGPAPLGEKAARASSLMQGASLEDQERIAYETLMELKEIIVPFTRKLYEVMSESVRDSTGMTLEDFVWLRDYEPPETRES